ncbi:MAG: SapC family protein [Caulobacteraceae bacterium]
MTSIVVLDNTLHRHVTVQGGLSGWVDRQRFVQVVLREFSLLAVQYPILVSKNVDTGDFFVGAVLGFDEGENLFAKPGGGHEGYRPLNLQRAPFYVADGRLAIDLDSPIVGTGRGEALFDTTGQATPFLENIHYVLGEFRTGLEMTRIFIDTLLKLKLLVEMEVDLSFDDGTRRQLEGLYTIDQDVVRDLDDAAALELFRRGYMYLIHLMIVSVKQIAQLARRKNERLLDPPLTAPAALV